MNCYRVAQKKPDGLSPVETVKGTGFLYRFKQFPVDIDRDADIFFSFCFCAGFPFHGRIVALGVTAVNTKNNFF